VNPVLQDAGTVLAAFNQYDFLFLDTEPHTRFNELLRFWSGLKPGGFVAIHDLSPHMSQTGQTVNGMVNWPFGEMPSEMKELMRTRQLSNFHFNTPRGLYLGQKFSEDFFKV
jgi:predicted O-methyltransferase YrrM